MYFLRWHQPLSAVDPEERKKQESWLPGASGFPVRRASLESAQVTQPRPGGKKERSERRAPEGRPAPRRTSRPPSPPVAGSSWGVCV